MLIIIKSVSWISVDAAARAVVDMAESDVPHIHLVHPRPVSWSSIIEPLAKSLDLPVVSYDEWVSKLERSGDGLTADEEVEVMRHNPALKIIDMFINTRTTSVTRSSGEAMGLPQLEVSEAQRSSPSLSAEQLPKLAAEDALRWVAYWKATGFL